MAFVTMMESGMSLRKAFGSRERVEDIFNEMVRLYAKTYSGRPE